MVFLVSLCSTTSTNPNTEETSVKNSTQSESAHHRCGSSQANQSSEENAVLQTQPLLAKQNRYTRSKQATSQASLPGNTPYLGPSWLTQRSAGKHASAESQVPPATRFVKAMLRIYRQQCPIRNIGNSLRSTFGAASP